MRPSVALVDVSLRPVRSRVVPTLALASPVLWLLNRHAGRQGTPDVGLLVLLVVTVPVVGYLLASVLVSRLAPEEPRHWLTRVVLQPDDATLAVLSILVVSFVAAVAVSQVVTVPVSLLFPGRMLGGFLVLPLLICYGGLVVLSSVALGRGPPLWIGVTVVAVGVTLSTVWLATIATIISDLTREVYRIITRHK